eukprot:8433148-Alexandrium_andersonii.AAC.1
MGDAGKAEWRMTNRPSVGEDSPRLACSTVTKPASEPPWCCTTDTVPSSAAALPCCGGRWPAARAGSCP